MNESVFGAFLQSISDVQMENQASVFRESAILSFPNQITPERSSSPDTQTLVLH